MIHARTFVLIVSLAVAVPATAISTGIPGTGLPSAVDFSSTILPERGGVVSWKTLAQVEPVKKDGKIVPGFSRDILALDRKDVKVQGFMIPLEVGEKQKRFLISAIPPHCSFCLPAGPEAVVEVESKVPVVYTFDPIVVTGKFAVLKGDLSGVLYRLTEAGRVDASTSPRTTPPAALK
jgi:hypothetical protein